MPPIINTYALGQMGNNSYLFGDPDNKEAVLIDPSFEVSSILPELAEEGWTLKYILLTHAHFDHTYGIYELMKAMQTLPPIGLHPGDANLYNGGGLGELMGLHRDALPAPALHLAEGEVVQIGRYALEVIHCPGHTPGHVFFYSKDADTAFVGDIIFQQGIGRTDLPGGNGRLLLENISKKILALPDETALLPGHGPATSVGEERWGNPFLS
jgi:glyoxylase-like metal-dependent hydrolase (beta-lactamase superfamily II)